MTTWEYKCFYSDRENYKGIFKGFKPGKLEKDLNELGGEGWEMVGYGMNDGANAAVIIFKRAIEQ